MDLNNLSIEQIEAIIKELEKEIDLLKIEIDNKQLYLQQLINSVEEDLN